MAARKNPAAKKKSVRRKSQRRKKLVPRKFDVAAVEHGDLALVAGALASAGAEEA